VVGETKMARNMENAYFQTEKIRQMWAPYFKLNKK
jgi:hypothetical protein